MSSIRHQGMMSQKQADALRAFQGEVAGPKPLPTCADCGKVDGPDHGAYTGGAHDFVPKPVLKPLLIGEVNPYGADPEMALYPLPEEASGGRLARILGLSRGEYLRRFDRVNLCTGRWSIGEARQRAFDLEILGPPPGRALILLGTKVALAFGCSGGTNFTKFGRYYFLPHPSGRNRIWNRPGAHEKARELLKEFLVPEIPGATYCCTLKGIVE